MEELFRNPSSIRQGMKEALAGAHEQKEITEQEMEALVRELEEPPRPSVTDGLKTAGKKGEVVLRGEGGSGEQRRPVVAGQGGNVSSSSPQMGWSDRVASFWTTDLLSKGGNHEPSDKGTPSGSSGVSDVKGSEEGEVCEAGGEGEEKKGEQQPMLDLGQGQGDEVAEVKGKEEEEEEEEEYWSGGGEGVGGDVEAHGGDVSGQAPSASSKGQASSKAEIAELKSYCEEQFASIMSIIQPLASRIETLEREASGKIPIRGINGSPPRVTRHRSIVGMEPPALGGRKGSIVGKKPVIDKEKVSTFARVNPVYPSMRAVRAAKLNQLQRLLGVTELPIEVKVSEWTAEGLYTLLVVKHEAE